MKSIRLAPALSAIALASALAGCAASDTGPRSASIFGGKADVANIGLATRAMAALGANDVKTATGLAERAVASSPTDAGFRALLGNSYFAGGRFASAEAAYGDSLSLVANQPQVVLKLALVQIAQGKRSEALALLAAARDVLDVSDYGLALALAGHTQDAVSALDAAARQPGADARLRQNLALAYSLVGDWEQARTIAAQDLAAELVDQRMQQWMTLAKPARAADQVAALIGVVPAVSDPGQPARLALRGTAERLAQATADTAPVSLSPVASVAEGPAAFPTFQAPAPLPMPVAEVAVADAPVAPLAEPAFVAAAVEPEPAYVAPLPRRVVKAAAARVAKLVEKRPAAMARRSGSSTAVVQIGAYGSPQRVAAAWSAAARRYSVLRAYAPHSARFSGPNGVVYRLAVRGFASQSEASGLCNSLRRAGGSCFVRSVAGDVQLASR
jgi:Flp pilus assembly protein TadD